MAAPTRAEKFQRAKRASADLKTYRAYPLNLDAGRSEPILGARGRRSFEQMVELKAWIYHVCRLHQPLTVRQAFYRLVVANVIPKTQNQYDNTVVEQIKQMREGGVIPWSWIVDNTRLVRKPTTFGDLQRCLQHTHDFYRRDLWESQDVYVEIWCESDSAAGVLADVTERWDVPLMASRGFSSVTFLHETAGTLRQRGKHTFLYYFGDRDPSGLAIDAKIQEKLEDYEAGDFTFRRVAVTEQQVRDMKLPGSPPKKTDSRSKTFEGNAVEIESIPPGVLRQLCESCIRGHIDQAEWERCELIEKLERETLGRVLLNYGNEY